MISSVSMSKDLDNHLKQGADGLSDLALGHADQATVNGAQFLKHYVMNSSQPGMALAGIVVTVLANNPDFVADFDACVADLRTDF